MSGAVLWLYALAAALGALTGFARHDGLSGYDIALAVAVGLGSALGLFWAERRLQPLTTCSHGVPDEDDCEACEAVTPCEFNPSHTQAACGEKICVQLTPKALAFLSSREAGKR